MLSESCDKGLGRTYLPKVQRCQEHQGLSEEPVQGAWAKTVAGEGWWGCQQGYRRRMTRCCPMLMPCGLQAIPVVMGPTLSPLICLPQANHRHVASTFSLP